jgi:hypothetical protein
MSSIREYSPKRVVPIVLAILLLIFGSLTALPGHATNITYTLTPVDVGASPVSAPVSINNDGDIALTGSSGFLVGPPGGLLPISLGTTDWVFPTVTGISSRISGNTTIVGYGMVVSQGYSSYGFSYSNNVLSSHYPSSDGDFYVTGISNSTNKMVGYAILNGSYVPYFYTGGAWESPTMPTAYANAMLSGVNNSGVTIGSSGSGVNFYYNSVSGTVTPISPTGFTENVHITGISDSGKIVGFGIYQDGVQRSFVCDTSGNCSTIGAAGWDNLEVYGINAAGMIVGLGKNGNDPGTVFTGTPVPLPGSLFLIAGGLAALAGLRRRFQQA